MFVYAQIVNDAECVCVCVSVCHGVCGARARVFVRACCGYRYCDYCEYGNQRLKALPASIGHLVGLRTIQITGMYALERLPDDLSKLTGLSNLEASSSRRTSLSKLM